MNIGQIIKDDIANGTGIRLSLFISGCTNRCPGCFNPETWDFGYGQRLTAGLAEKILLELRKPQYEGLTILGGEPFELSNQMEVGELVKTARWLAPDKTIWIYTGCIYERDLTPGGLRHTYSTDYILDHIDVLVDGPFVEGLKDLTLPFRGSSNQRIIDMKRTREAGRVCLLDGYGQDAGEASDGKDGDWKNSASVAG